MEEYPLFLFLKKGIPVTINTDNRTVSNTSITRELQMIQEYYGCADEVLETLMKHARDAAFSS